MIGIPLFSAITRYWGFVVSYTLLFLHELTGNILEVSAYSHFSTKKPLLAEGLIFFAASSGRYGALLAPKPLSALV